MAEPKKEGEPYVYQEWPAWCSGPNGEYEVVASEDELPKGWSRADDGPPVHDL